MGKIGRKERECKAGGGFAALTRAQPQICSDLALAWVQNCGKRHRQWGERGKEGPETSVSAPSQS